jgi:hypothetical protein
MGPILGGVSIRCDRPRSSDFAQWAEEKVTRYRAGLMTVTPRGTSTSTVSPKNNPSNHATKNVSPIRCLIYDSEL